MFNQFTGLGRLGRDPEIRNSQSGTKICNMTVACDSGWGENKSTYWARVVAFGKTAEFCERYLKKGDAVLVVGRMQERKWQDQSGNDRFSTEVVADRVQSAGRSDGTGGGSDKAANPEAHDRPGGYDDIDDCIPF